MSTKENKLLFNHKKVSSRFIPPIAQLGLTEISYLNRIFPEIIWIGLINDKIGYKAGIELVEYIAKKLLEIRSGMKHLNFALASAYKELNDEHKKKIVDDLLSRRKLSIVQDSLAPLICLYHGFPLSFFGPPSATYSRELLIKRIKECVETHIDKYEQPGVILQASAVYIRGVTGGLYFVNGIKPPDLNKIFNDFNSDEAQKAAAFVRSSILLENLIDEKDNKKSWARLFWNQGYKIDKCILPGE